MWRFHLALLSLKRNKQWQIFTIIYLVTTWKTKWKRLFLTERITLDRFSKANFHHDEEYMHRERSKIDKYDMLNPQNHLSNQTFQQKILGNASKVNFDLKNHIKVLHEGTKAFICDQCLKAFGHKSNLRKHMKILHELS